VVLATVLIAASIRSYVILVGEDDEDDFPSKAKVPSLRVGMDWWYNIKERIIDHDTGTNETYDRNYYQIMVRNITTINGMNAYGISSIEAIQTITRHSNSMESYLSIDNLNHINDMGEEFVMFDFPLFDGKRWNWIDEDGNNITYICKTYKNIETTAGTYDTYHVRSTWSEEEGDERDVYINDYYYSPKLKYIARGEYRMDHYSDDALTVTLISFLDLVLYGTSDSDNDGLSNTGESWFGTDPEEKDTDSDGLDDLGDYIPLFDLGLSINLTYVSTDENVESIDEVTIYGEEDGADFYFDLSNDDNDDVLVTDPIENTDATDLDIQYKIDVFDDTYILWIWIKCFDDDNDNTDDEIDISEDSDNQEFIMRFTPSLQMLKKEGDSPGNNELELGVQHEVTGNGNGDYDATLRFVVSEIDMATEE